MPEPLTAAVKKELLATLDSIGADVRKFRGEHPASPLDRVAFQLAALTGELQAVVASAPVQEDPAHG